MPITLNGTTGVTYPDGVLQTSGVPAPGTAGNVLTSNGTIWTSAAAAAFDAGTRMLFAQTTAPTGWTKDTTNYNNFALRVVTGAASTGGSVGFTTAFASQTPAGSVSINTSGLSAGSTTLTTAQIPSHNHSFVYRSSSGGSGSSSFSVSGPGGDTNLVNSSQPSDTTAPSATIGNNGSGNSHNHSISGSATGSFTGTAINLAVQYLDVITATKN
jgi:hypothetical protein